LLQNRVEFKSLTTGAQTARWIGNLMDDLVVAVGPDKAKDVMEVCGRQCIGLSILDKARKIQQEARDIDELLAKLNQAHIGGGKMRREHDVIYASYEQCYCGSVSKAPTPINAVYCQCSCGWYKNLLETILGKPVKVELIDSIIHGANTCQFKIYI
jgi:predicted hydrocarbon binding protein